MPEAVRKPISPSAKFLLAGFCAAAAIVMAAELDSPPPAPPADADAAAVPTPATKPAEPDPLAGIAAGGHMENSRPTSSTLALLPALTGDNVIEFSQLRMTKLGTKPPPVFLKRVAALDGKTVRMRGFMAPYDSLSDMHNFMLVSTSVGCYFCTPPSPTEVILVRVASKDKAEFIGDVVEIEGTLSLWKSGSSDKGHQQFLYIINDANYRAAGKKGG